MLHCNNDSHRSQTDIQLGNTELHTLLSFCQMACLVKISFVPSIHFYVLDKLYSMDNKGEKL